MSAPKPTEAQAVALYMISHSGGQYVQVKPILPMHLARAALRPAVLDVLEGNGWVELRREPDGRSSARITYAGRLAAFKPVTVTKPGLATFVNHSGKTVAACDARQPGATAEEEWRRTWRDQDNRTPRSKRDDNPMREATLAASVGDVIGWAHKGVWGTAAAWKFSPLDEVQS